MDHEYKILILESHLDTFGHVNNAAYLTIFEEARWDLITANGYGMTEVQKRKQGPVILEVNLKFIKELKLRQEITVRTAMESYPGKIGTLVQKMVNSKGEICSEARFTFGLFDLAERKLILPTPAWMKAVGL